MERSRGRTLLPGGRLATVEDSPGTYSLASRSTEELLALESIAGIDPRPRPDLVVVTVDASQLSRNLYLVLQIIELRVPVIVALNMTDTLEESGQKIDVSVLQRELGVPVVPMMARRGTGLGDLVRTIDRVLQEPSLALPGWRWIPKAGPLTEDIAAIAEAVPESWHHGSEDRRRALALWALLSIDAEHYLAGVPESLRRRTADRRQSAETVGRDLDREIIEGRYGWIDGCVSRCLREDPRRVSMTDRVDRILLHPALGRLASTFISSRSLTHAGSRLHILTLALLWIMLVLALMRPQWLEPYTEVRTEGYDLMLAVDTSRSMEALDFTVNGRQVTRMAVIKGVLGRFIKAREGDRIGIVVFGSQAFVLSPLSVDRQLPQGRMRRWRRGHHRRVPGQRNTRMRRSVLRYGSCPRTSDESGGRSAGRLMFPFRWACPFHA